MATVIIQNMRSVIQTMAEGSAGHAEHDYEQCFCWSGGPRICCFGEAQEGESKGVPDILTRSSKITKCSSKLGMVQHYAICVKWTQT